MLDISIAYNRYKYLGHEFLTWLWFIMENEPRSFKDEQGQDVTLDMGGRIVLENSRQEAIETVTIKGSESELEEGRLALSKGAMVTEMNLLCGMNDRLWSFTLKGESLDLSGLKIPEDEKAEDGDALEGTLLLRMASVETIIAFVHHTFRQFLKLRLSDQWTKKTVPGIKKWAAAQ
ncbi:MAG: hypothetical protein AB1724_04850 [Thermodesulfobacteriota bacterium]